MRPSWFAALVPWVPVLTGTGILAGYVIYAIALSTTSPPSPQVPQVPPQAQEAAEPTPSATASPPAGGNAEPPDPGLYPVQDSPSPEPPPATEPPGPPPAPEVVGKYRIEETFSDAFIGKVVLANTGDEAQDWTVELAFGPEVGKLNEFWVDGARQPTVRREDGRYIFSSSVPIEAGSWQKLKFHFDRFGWEIKPTVCTVNGAACAVRDY